MSASKACCVQTPVAMHVCYPGTDCENQKILDMYGFHAQYRPLGSCAWIDLPVVKYPTRCIEFRVDADGEYEFRWRALRHGVKWSGGQEVYSTVPGPWSPETVFSAAVAPPIAGQAANVILAPGTVC
jgi:hypothetical protein